MKRQRMANRRRVAWLKSERLFGNKLGIGSQNGSPLAIAVDVFYTASLISPSPAPAIFPDGFAR